jgi:hypothetical protein
MRIARLPVPSLVPWVRPANRRRGLADADRGARGFPLPVALFGANGERVRVRGGRGQNPVARRV